MKAKAFRLPRAGLAVTMLLALSSPLQAMQNIEFSSNIEVEQVATDASGKRNVSFAPPGVVVPGDRLRFTLRLENRTADAANALKFVNPMPPEVRFDSTTDTEGFAVSVDGGETYGALETLTVAVDDAAPRAATPSDVTHVQWTLAEPLAPGATKTVTFFGVVR